MRFERPFQRGIGISFVAFLLLTALGASTAPAPASAAKKGDDAPPGDADVAWRLEKQVDGIEVYTREVAGSGIRAFKGEAIVEADPESVLAVLRDSDRYQDWFPNVPESRLLRREGNVSYQYSVTAAVWPIDDRDNIFRSTLEREADTGAIEIAISAAPDAHPEQPGRVRVRYARGRWRLEPEGDGRTRVLFEMHLEPGGGIPAWMANARVVSTPLEALANLRSRVQRAESQPSER